MFPNPRQLAGILTLVCLGTGPLSAHALLTPGTLRASASDTANPTQTVTVETTAGQALAQYPDARNPQAEALARRREVAVGSLGSSSFFSQLGGAADSSSTYQLWSLRENRALTAEEAAPLQLSFDYRFSGTTTAMPGDTLRSLGFGAILRIGNVAEYGDYATLVCGLGGCAGNGHTALFDQPAIDIAFSLLHTDSTGGEMSLSIQGSAAADATIDLQLVLEGIELLTAPQLSAATFLLQDQVSSATRSSWVLDDGLAVRFVESNEIITVVPAAGGPGQGVPVPGTVPLLLAAALAASLGLRRVAR